MAFKPEQIKSAIGNNGDFDANNPDIRYSKEGNLISSDKKKALEFVTTNKVQFPAVVQQINKSLEISLGALNNDVNTRYSKSNQTDTPEFKA